VCGIAGIVGSLAGPNVDRAVIARMCHEMIHRGPDDEGIYAKGKIGLGMRRLSIIDLAGGRQPIHNEDKTIWAVLNGEIYNFPELSKSLMRSGHHLHTRCDTEVIPHLYEEFGTAFVKKLRGMFALALYDERQCKLLLARDRLGEKPLFYALSRERLLFGSEIKALLAAAPELIEVNREALLEFFTFGYVSDPHTSFVGIKKLPPGHLLEYRDGKIEITQYWDLPAYGTSQPGSEEDCLAELERRLAEAVSIQMNSDVPLGAFLSGGVDSSTVVALMSRASSRPIKTFSIGFTSDESSELRYARMVAQRFATDHHECIIHPNFSQTLESLTQSLEEPFADSSIIPTYHVSRLARQHVTVALSGDGGDELFAGYDRYLVSQRRRRFDFMPSWAGRLYRHRVHPWLPRATRGRNFAYNASLPSPERYLDSICVLDYSARNRQLFSDDFCAWAQGQPAATEGFRRHWDRAPASDHLSRLLYLDTKTYLPADILTKVDRMSMATSLEVRAPILDHLFVEYVTALPARWKLRGGVSKYIFRNLSERVGVPREVLDRPKRGFSMPLEHWMRKGLKEELSMTLLEPRTLQRGYFNPAAVRLLVEDHFSGRRDNSSEMWLLLMVELWHRNFLPTVRESTVSALPSLTHAQRESHVPSARASLSATSTPRLN